MQWKGIAKYAAIGVGILLVSIVAIWPLFIPDGDTPEYRMEGAYYDVQGKGVWVTSRVGDERFQVMADGVWTDIVIKGVNIGAAKPGYFPGEAAITYEEYVRWFEWIGEMNANAVRIYTHHPPDFYRALFEYNRAHKDPLFLLQGITMDERMVIEARDLYNGTVTAQFIDNMATCVDIIHGNIEVPVKTGIAHGEFEHDISNYVIGFILGIEIDPLTVLGTDSNNNDVKDLDGDFFRTDQGTPTEIWFARMMEWIAGYETNAYGGQRPVSFVNWPTTDPLNHPNEPFYYEDLAWIDQNKIQKKDLFYPGQFASYHVYPYYPDFMNIEPGYLNYTVRSGRTSNFAGYLHDIVGHHRFPVLVAEFGVSSSRGNAHENPLGMDHGGLTEWEQGQFDSMMFSDMIEEGCCGGLLFSWQNEWFKRVWNTMDYMEPGRRPYWYDVQTCEQNFGVLGFDPIGEHDIVLDGMMDDWRDVPLLGKGDRISYNSYWDGGDDERDIETVSVAHDAAYLYIRISFDHLSDIPWHRFNAMIIFDTVQDQGITRIPYGGGVRSDRGIDLAILLDGMNGSKVLVDSYYDANHYDYRITEGLLSPLPYANISDNGIFHTQNLTISRGYRSADGNMTHPYESYETGLLRWGVSDPDRYDYDSLADINYGEDSIEMRIPWLLLNFRDPSRKEVLGDLWKGGLQASQRIEGIHLAVLTWKPDGNGNGTKGVNSPSIADSIPLPVDGILLKDEFMFYTWENWDIPRYDERLKESYYLMRETYGRY